MRGSGGRVTRVVVIVVGLVLAVWVLFTWVFPWVTDRGFDPTVG